MNLISHFELPVYTVQFWHFW